MSELCIGLGNKFEPTVIRLSSKNKYGHVSDDNIKYPYVGDCVEIADQFFIELKASLKS